MWALVALGLVLSAYLLWRAHSQARRERAFEANSQRLQARVLRSQRVVDATNCRHCGENIQRVPQMYRIGGELVCLACLQRLKRAGWGPLAKAMGVQPVQLVTVKLVATPEGVEESE